MLGIAINVGMDRNGLNAHGTRGAYNSAGDFTAVGNQNFFKHSHSIAIQTQPI